MIGQIIFFLVLAAFFLWSGGYMLMLSRSGIIRSVARYEEYRRAPHSPVGAIWRWVRFHNHAWLAGRRPLWQVRVLGVADLLLGIVLLDVALTRT